MKRIIPFSFFLVIGFLFIMNSCATTSLTSVWMNDKYHGGTLKNILIVGVIEPRTLRESFENELVRQMKIKGTKGVPSYTVFPERTMPEQAKMESKIKELGMDSILIARLVSINDIEAYDPYPMYLRYEGLYGYYALCCQYVVSSGYDVRFETKLFEAENDKLIWSALSETELERTPETIISSFITAIMKDLYSKKLIQ